jgi:hypothetical protein
VTRFAPGVAACLRLQYALPHYCLTAVFAEPQAAEVVGDRMPIANLTPSIPVPRTQPPFHAERRAPQPEMPRCYVTDAAWVLATTAAGLAVLLSCAYFGDLAALHHTHPCAEGRYERLATQVSHPVGMYYRTCGLGASASAGHASRGPLRSPWPGTGSATCARGRAVACTTSTAGRHNHLSATIPSQHTCRRWRASHSCCALHAVSVVGAVQAQAWHAATATAGGRRGSSLAAPAEPQLLAS